MKIILNSVVNDNHIINKNGLKYAFVKKKNL